MGKRKSTKSSKPKTAEERLAKFTELANEAPRVSALSDLALSDEETYRDSFNLRFRMGSVYDILRHPATNTPLAMAVYGTWGAGKTTAMKWLHGLLNIWNNRKEKAPGDISVIPVWFYPWKYHDKEDVWRGLVAEVIIRGLEASDPTLAKVTNAAKRFGIFLGRSFVHVLAQLKLKADTGGAGVVPKAEAELSLAGIKDILEEWREADHPERAYLNEFEDALRSWVNDTLGPNERMVIFIDDLDRCLPEVALQVLEALKLYLNIEKLIFVVGVDREVVDKLVAEHYEKLGLERDKSKHYLAKMFQVEVEVSPSERLIEDFLDEQFGQLSYWRNQLAETETDPAIFRKVILNLAGRNPREIKRLINSAMMVGAGVAGLEATEEAPEAGFTFAQGLQLFFVRKILDDRFGGRGWLIGSRLGDRFFGQWSQVVRDHEEDEKFPRRVRLPRSYLDKAKERREDAGDITFTPRRKEPADKTKGEEYDFSRVREPYREMLQNPEFTEHLDVLGDANLGELMRIEFPQDTLVVAKVTGGTMPEGSIRQAIADQLGKEPDKVTEEDLAGLTELSLMNPDVSDLAPLRSLTALRTLILDSTSVSDVSPLAGLASLGRLDLRGTPVSDISPLAGLTKLQRLYLNRTQVSDISPLRTLTNLQVLFLSNTQVTDVFPIAVLANLRDLRLLGTPVTDTSPLARLTKLHRLQLNSTQVSDISPLAGLTNLQELHLSGTRVSDVSPLAGWTKLVLLDLRGTEVSAEQVGALREALPDCRVFT